MNFNVNEVQIVPIKPTDGLVGFASFVLNDWLYLGSIGIFTRPEGGYRLTYPTKKAGIKNINLFYPINRNIAKEIEEVIIEKYEEVMKQNDRYNSFNS